MGWRTIVVGTDGSDTANRAIDKAALLVKHVDGQLLVVCATAGIGLHDYKAMEILAETEKRLQAMECRVETMYREGSPDKVLTDIAGERDADLVVVGNVGMGKARRFRLGPIPERVASNAPCDVLIAMTKEDEPEMPDGIYKRVLVGVDGSPTAGEAARKAFDLGMMFRIGVTLLYVAGDTIVGAIVLEQTQKTKPRALGVQTKIVEGEPARAICETAINEGLDLIVVGNRGMTGMRRHLLGSVPTQVIHSAPTDVLIAKTADRTVDDLAPGTGGLVDMEGRKLAVFKDVDGTLTALSPRCAHMGCTVDWNQAELTWDCPCHGSRYQKDGSLLQGPAKAGLDPA